MVTASPGDNITRPDAPLAVVQRRLGDSRWLILALVAAIVVLVLAEAVSPIGGLGAVVALLVAVAVIPRSTAAPLEEPAEPLRSAWTETGIERFAHALPDPCFILDQRGVVLYANDRAVSTFSIRPGEHLTFRLRVPDLIGAFDRVSKGGPPEAVDFAERVPTERWFSAWFARLEPDKAAPIALIIDDLTERRRSERIRVDFVANASHELRTPLASLAGFIETLQGPAREDAVARERFLKIMRDQATRMSRLVDDLLSLSRIEMKAHMRPSGEVELGGIVQHVIDALEPLARDLGVSVEADLGAGPAVVPGDRDELIQVFENLVENACKYGQQGQRIAITLVPGEGPSGPAVAVRDFGPGIAEEHLPRLTERFYRIDVEASRQHRGTGLGLAVVKHILTRHQARLSIESRLGEGSTFTVVFPPGAAGKRAA